MVSIAGLLTESRDVLRRHTLSLFVHDGRQEGVLELERKAAMQHVLECLLMANATETQGDFLVPTFMFARVRGLTFFPLLTTHSLRCGLMG